MKAKFQYSTGIILLTLSLPAAADIIYSGLLDTAIPTNFTGITVTVGDGTLNPFFGGVGVANNNFLQPGRIGTGNLDAIVNFGAGATINSGMTLDAALGYGGSSTHVGNGASQFAAGSEGYVGFKLDGVNYGWMRVVFTNNTGGAVVKDWAYDNSGTSLVTGNVLQSAVSGGAQTVTLTSASGSFTLGTAITDALGNTGGVVNSVVKQGAGTTVLSAANSYTGTTTVTAGTLSVATIGNGGVASGNLGSATNAAANLVFDGGTLQYTGATASTDRNFTINTGKTATVEVTANNLTISGSSTATNGALTKTGTGTLTLSGANTYTGVTTVNAGSLAINGDQSAATGAVTVGAGATDATAVRLKGIGTVGGNTTFAADPDAAGAQVGGIHSPGNSVGTQTFDAPGAAVTNLTYNSGSIFEWELASTPAATAITTDLPGAYASNRGTAYDAVNVTGTLGGTDAIFRVVLDGTQTFADTFWDTSRTWTDIFRTGDGSGTSNVNYASIFSGGFQYYNYSGSGTTLAALTTPTVDGSFTLSGSTLSWSAVPEPSSALAGLLLAAGLLRRRRSA